MLIAYLLLCLFFFGVGTYNIWMEAQEENGELHRDKKMGVFVGVIMTAWTSINLLIQTGMI